MASQANTEAEETDRLLKEAASNAPPALESTDYSHLERKSVKIGDYPAALVIVGFNDKETGPRVGMAYAIGTPSETYIIHFMLIPRERFNELRPMLERIAASFRLI